MKTTPTPERKQIEHWISLSQTEIQEKIRLKKEGFYEKENLPIQGHYIGLADWFTCLGRSRYLNKEANNLVRSEFENATNRIIECFRIAYDPTASEYGKGEIAWDRVTEIPAKEGMNAAILTGSFEKAKEMAKWWREPPVTRPVLEIVNRYVYALKHVILFEFIKAKEVLSPLMEMFAKKVPEKHDYKKNFYTLAFTLSGIIQRDKYKFNEGLLMQLNYHEHEARYGDIHGTDEEFFCDNAIALAILGQHYGLEVPVETASHWLLPERLLIRLPRHTYQGAAM
jgi:hypothetical protein